MSKIKFNDGTKALDAKVFVKAESIMFAKDDKGFMLINRSKVDESKEVEFEDTVLVQEEANDLGV